MKINTPKVREKDGIFAKLPGFTIVGNSVSVVPEIGSFRKEGISETGKFKTTTPSLIPGPKGDPGEKGEKGDKGRDGIPNAKIIKIQVCVNGTTKSIQVYAP